MSVSVARQSKRREENCLERYSGELRNRNEEYLVNICESNIVWAQVIFPVLLVAKFTFLHRDGARMHRSFNKQYISKKKKCVPEFPEYMNTYILIEGRKFQTFSKENYAVVLGSCCFFTKKC